METTTRRKTERVSVIPIQSYSDIVTNSSSEIFCLKLDKAYEALTKETGIKFTELKTEQELREFVTSGWNDLDATNIEWDPYQNERFMIYDLEKYGKTPDEIWEFFKCFYTPLLGHAYLSIDRDSWECSMIRNFFKYEKETK